ncbi:hypothetical protein CCR97_19010 [Rhodoplanes elegans]|uniref:Uncharacterized protein n=1 Tax=Rhodoplanes elegans TaxID=29408 RepID=A0A327KSU9_9BRAD|nr:hypothetical protein [Rhodoplanes elegans]MBK5960275.1 hypothetical protein [Rhodoplanes elegans]RAI40723.1 hypothetical protein CH338_05395 [Rhodoplanes elegans]
MSAAIISADPSGIVVHSDGATFDPRDSYRLLALHSKVVRLTHVPALLVGFGCEGFTETMAMCRSPLWRDFDDMLGRLADDVHATRAYLRGTVRRGRPCSALVVAGGWSAARSAFELWQCLITDEDGDAVPALERLGDCVVLPMPSDEALTAAGFLVDDRVAITPDRIIDFFEVQRAEPGRSVTMSDDSAPGHVVGGFVESTTLTMVDGQPRIISTIVHRWPDIIGEPIRPGGGHVDIAAGARTAAVSPARD